jgi:chaperonin cofactor prefoldin
MRSDYEYLYDTINELELRIEWLEEVVNTLDNEIDNLKNTIKEIQDGK